MAESYKQIIELQAKTAKAARDIDRFVKEAEKKISSLKGVLEGKTATGAARKRPLSQEERRRTEQQIAAEKTLIKLRQVKLGISKAANKEATETLSKQLQVNAAVERQTNLLNSLKRAGVTGERGERVKQIKAAADANKGNVKILNQTNNELVKILETQREITRTDIAQDRIARKNAEGKQFDKRVAQLEAVGVSEKALTKIQQERFKLAELNSKKQTDLANRQLAKVEELIAAQEKLNQTFLKPTTRPGPASPIRGSVRIEGSPKAKEEADKQRAAELKALDQKEQQLNRFAAAGRRLKDKAEREDEKRRQARLKALDAEETAFNKFYEGQRKLREANQKAARADLKRTEAAALRLIRLSEKAGRLANKIQNQIPQQLALPSTEILKPEKKGIQILDSQVRGREERIQKRLERNAERNKQLAKETLEVNNQRIRALQTIAQDKREEGRATIKLAQDELRLTQQTQKRVAASEAAAARARKQKFTDIATGFGFPLLFGGGPLQAIAGGLGGAAGGLGGSIAASAIVAQAEAFAKAAAQAGQALNSTGGALDLMREKSLFSTPQIEEQARVLEEQGKVSELSALLTQQLVDKIGNSGVQALQDLGTETDEVTRLWSELTIQLQALVAGPLRAFLEAINTVLGGVTTDLQFEARRKDLGPEGAAALDARVAELQAGDTSGLNRQQIRSGKGRGIGALSPIEAKRVALGEEQFQVPATARLPVTAEDTRRFTVSDSELKAQQRILEAQKRILQTSEDAIKVQQNKLNLVKAEGPAAKALLQFAERRTQIEQKFAKQVEAARKAGGPTQEQTINNFEKAKGLALSENQIRLDKEIKKISEDLLKPLNDKIKGYEDQITLNETYRNLIEKGINPELAKELTNIDLIADKQLEILNTQILQLETAMQEVEATEAQIQKLEDLKDLRKGIETKREGAKAAATAADAAKPGKIEAYVDQLRKELDDTQGMIVSLAQTIENEIGSAMSSAITGVITGTQTVEEAMSTMFANIGKAFIDMATEMIAKALMLKALGVLQGAFGGFGGGASAVPSSAYGDMSVAGPGFFSGGMIPGFANGGAVRPNGTYLVGERGPELLTMGNQSGYVHSNTSEAMDRYRAGRSNSGSGGSLNVNYNVTQINGMNFVTEEQFRAGMTKAAKDGARMGEAGTFKTMRNSRSNRARVGL